MLTDEAMHERMRDGWAMGQPFTVCGNGSTLRATERVREWLPRIVGEHGIATLNDAGAGDLAWIGFVRWQWPIHYRPFDLIPRSPRVMQADITRVALPVADAVLCRMVLNHLDPARVERALGLFRASARYLIATQFQGDSLAQRSEQFVRYDLRPLLGEPLDSVGDGDEAECSLALWRL